VICTLPTETSPVKDPTRNPSPDQDPSLFADPDGDADFAPTLFATSWAAKQSGAFKIAKRALQELRRRFRLSIVELPPGEER
jgi:hypothetical protein